jgi:hypothetical protein
VDPQEQEEYEEPMLVTNKKLLEVPWKFKDLFNSILGDWKTKPVSFELKRDAKAYSQQSFPYTMSS